MLREEFENLINDSICQPAFDKINTVYTFHPSISETKGKEQIAYLYMNFEMTVIEDMLPRAEKIMEIEEQMRLLQSQVSDLKKRKDELSNI